MTEPLTFPSSTPAFALPLLFSGQAQKEFFVNQAMSTIDALLQLAVEDSLPAPPADPADGSTYRVTENATGDWSGKEDLLALRIAGAWQFVTPARGVRIYDRVSRQILLFDAGWKAASEPVSPTGGAVVDAEARATIDALLQELRNAGIFAS